MITFKAISVECSSTIRGRGTTCISIKLHQEESDKAGLFYELWAENGDDWLKNLLVREGYLFSKDDNKL